MWSNCVIFALKLWRKLRWRNRPGRDHYLCIRISRAAKKGPHVLFGRLRDDGAIRVVSFVPDVPVRHVVTPPIFPGHVKWGDRPDVDPEGESPLS